MHNAVTKAYHFCHLPGISLIQITSLGQDEEDVLLLLWPPKRIYGDDVIPYVSTAFNSRLKGSFDRQLYGKISFKLFEAEPLLLL